MHFEVSRLHVVSRPGFYINPCGTFRDKSCSDSGLFMEGPIEYNIDGSFRK